MNKIIDDFLASVPSRRWLLRKNLDADDMELGFLSDRFGVLPESFRHFIREIAELGRVDGSAWFLSGKHYRNETAFRWNELEYLTLGIQSAPSAERQMENQRLWGNRLPLFFSVYSDYAALCLVFENRRPSKVVKVSGPLFEEGAILAPSYDAFLESFFTHIAKTTALKAMM